MVPVVVIGFDKRFRNTTFKCLIKPPIDLKQKGNHLVSLPSTIESIRSDFIKDVNLLNGA
jgi:hypothetical protein